MTLFTGRLTGCQRDGDNLQNTEPGSMLSREREHDFSPSIERTLISFVLVNSVFLNSASRASDSLDSALQTFPGRLWISKKTIGSTASPPAFPRFHELLWCCLERLDKCLFERKPTTQISQ